MSSTPNPYDRQASFTSFQTPDAPTVGQNLEAEFNEIELSLDETQARLAEIQRDDGKLRNESVHPDSLSQEVRAILATRYINTLAFLNTLGDVDALYHTGLDNNPINGDTIVYSPDLGGAKAFKNMKPRKPVANITGTTAFVALTLNGHILNCTNAAGCTVTLSNGGVAEDAGSGVTNSQPGHSVWVYQNTTGPISFAAASGVTIRYSAGAASTSNSQYQLIECVRISATEWLVQPGDISLSRNYAWTGDHTWSRSFPNPSGVTIQEGTDQTKAVVYGYRESAATNDRAGFIEYQYDNTSTNATCASYITMYQRGALSSGFSVSSVDFAQVSNLSGGTLNAQWNVVQSPASAAYGGSGQTWTAGLVCAQEISYANRWQDFGFQRDFSLSRWVGGTLYAADCLFGPDGLSPSGKGFHATYGIIFAQGTNGGVSRGTYTPVYVARDTVPDTGVTVLLRGGNTSGGGFRPAAGVELDLNYTSGIKTSAATFTGGEAVELGDTHRLAFGGRKIAYRTANPATGSETWATGDFVFRGNGGTDTNLGWICTAGGSPGTWEVVSTKRLSLAGVGTGDGSETTAQTYARTNAWPMAVYNGSGKHIALGDTSGAWYNISVSGNVLNLTHTTGGSGTPRVNIGAGTAEIKLDGGVGFQGTNPIAKPTITGSRGGNAALASLLTALANYGLITDSTTA